MITNQPCNPTLPRFPPILLSLPPFFSSLIVNASCHCPFYDKAAALNKRSAAHITLVLVRFSSISCSRIIYGLWSSLDGIVLSPRHFPLSGWAVMVDRESIYWRLISQSRVQRNGKMVILKVVQISYLYTFSESLWKTTFENKVGFC